MKKKLLLIFLLICALATVLMACAAEEKITSKNVIELTEKIRPARAEGSVSGEAVAGDFSAQLLSLVAAGETNPVLSPLSAWLALSMCANGAAGQTLAEFDAVLGSDSAERNALAAALSGELTSLGNGTELAIANSAWADKDALIYQEFLQDIVTWYGAQAYEADLPSAEALAAINAWVRLNTQGLIDSLREENYPDETMLVLLNTLYMKAQWRQPFFAAFTRDQDFTLAGGDVVQAPFMRDYMCQRAYVAQDGMEGVLLPYEDGRLAFLALRSTDGESARELAARLDNETIAACVSGAQSWMMNLSLPKFTLEFSASLNDPLQEMGLTRAFDPFSADLSRLGEGPNGPLHISWVFQKVKMIVDEEGTEAAAVTEVVVAEGAALEPEDLIQLDFDSPFVYMVVDMATSFPLFMGVMDDPAAR